MKNAPPGGITPEDWWLTPAEQTFVQARHPANRLGFALLLLCFRHYGRFPQQLSDIDWPKREVLARQLGLAQDAAPAVELSQRTLERYRSEIRAWCGFRKATVADAAQLF